MPNIKSAIKRVEVAKARTKGLVHKNMAARKKSRLMKRYAKQFAQVG